jgi:hypothetical protein
MENTTPKNVALVSYVPARLFERVREDAARSNRSVAGQVRQIISEVYKLRDDVEQTR